MNKPYRIAFHLVLAGLVIPILLGYGFCLVIRHRLELICSRLMGIFLVCSISQFLGGGVGMAATPLELAALSAIESGDRDTAVGRHGEVSRYQILPAVWRSYSRSKAFQNPQIASQVAAAHLACVRTAFVSRTGRAASDFDLYVMWNAGAGYYAKVGFRADLVGRRIKDRAQRFEALKRALERASAAPKRAPFSSIRWGDHFTPHFCTTASLAHFRA